MSTTIDRCSQLRELHKRLVAEVNTLRRSVSEAEEEGVANPVETVNIMKSLEHSLNMIDQELQKCPPES